ncbi:hypothetical protein RINTHM_2950 [Richelia intracellularis HM01]|uniref:hypothetical protein n=1 Tax=Richelia intracellularis TaxID=1164990 RepID=UPI0002B5A227|nr:hypothetical protein [Richelia intracellularis]CCH64771.1 hypothetical protein RINTHM_2950 [Richelia intracellularis HM01]
MNIVTSREIAQFRSLLADYPQALEALDLIEDCEGDLEDATMTLSIRIGQEPGTENSEWLYSLAKKWRTVICRSEFREDLLNNNLKGVMMYFEQISSFPILLAAPILMYAFKKGWNNFCQPLDSTLNNFKV